MTIKTYSIEDIAHLLVEGVDKKNDRFVFVLADDHHAEVKRMQNGRQCFMCGRIVREILETER